VDKSSNKCKERLILISVLGSKTRLGEKNGTWSPLQRTARLPILELSDSVLSVTAGKKCQKTRYSRQKTSKMRIVGQYSRLKIKAQCFEQCFSNHFTIISNLISDYY
jgi:hypothetical protein